MKSFDTTLVFDLDDTLYLERDFVKSGYRALACMLDEGNTHQIEEKLWTYFQKDSSTVLNQYIEEFGGNVSLQELIRAYRFHHPSIDLSAKAQEVLTQLSKSYNMTLITDGHAQTQKNKFDALGLCTYFSNPIFSGLYNTKKPDPMLYEMAKKQFLNAKRFVYVADNPAKDFITPENLGWGCIRIKHPDGIYQHINFTGDIEIASISEVTPDLIQKSLGLKA